MPDQPWHDNRMNDRSLMTEDRPPFLRRWRNVYLLMVAVLVVEIMIMYWLTVHFS